VRNSISTAHPRRLRPWARTWTGPPAAICEQALGWPASGASLCAVRKVVSVLRGYWSAALLGLAAVVLLALGAPAKAALAGAGFAFVGAAVTRGIDLAKERRAELSQADVSRRRDLDETRRLAYALLAKRPSQRDPILVATLINALVHHGLGIDPIVAMRHLSAIDQGLPGASVEWLRGQIDRITADLDRTRPRGS
jgi:hypothetical protein